MRGRRVFRGRLVADGMCVAHLTWGVWTLGCLVPGVWFWRLAAAASDRTRDFIGPLFVGVLLAATGVVLLLVWRIATGAVVLRPDGLWCRPSFMRGRLVPYGDIRSLDGGTRLVYEREARGKRSRDALYLPPWVLSHGAFREELSRLAPGMEVRGEHLLRVLAFRRHVGGFLGLCLTVLVPLALFVVLPPLRASTPWLNPWVAGGTWVAIVVGLMAWQAAGERRLRQPR